MSELTKQQDESVHQTYYGLRLGMAVLGLMLYISIILLLISAGCYQGSISAYYYTPARPVFITTLCAIGVGLIIYRGNTRLENGILDVAGFLAMMVAFVPTGVPAPNTGCNRQQGLLTPELETQINNPSLTKAIQDAYVARLAENTSAATVNSVFSLFLAALIATILSQFLKPKFVDKGNIIPSERKTSLVIMLGLLAVGLGLYALVPTRFLGIAHHGSAIIFFLLILVIIFLNSAYSQSLTYKKLYKWTALGTIFAAVVVVVLWPLGIPGIFWLETVGVAGFIVFWVLQTRQLGGFIDRDSTREAAVRAGQPIEASEA